MARGNFSDHAVQPVENYQQEKKVFLGHGMCEVYGCPKPGHIYTEGWNCRYHYRKKGSELARITMLLKNHAVEFNWHEILLCSTIVDFYVKEIHKKAIRGFEPGETETFHQYRERIRLHIENLLASHETKQNRIIDRKIISTGDFDKSFA